MALNIIVKGGTGRGSNGGTIHRPTSFDTSSPEAVKQLKRVLTEREDNRRRYWNEEGWKQTEKAAERHAKIFDKRKNEHGELAFSCPIQFDGKMTDICREKFGHTDWKRDASYLKWIRKQPEAAWMDRNWSKGLDRMIDEAEDMKYQPAPFQQKSKEAKTDLSKLPACYRTKSTRAPSTRKK